MELGKRHTSPPRRGKEEADDTERREGAPGGNKASEGPRETENEK